MAMLLPVWPSGYERDQRGARLSRLQLHHEVGLVSSEPPQL